MGLPDSDYLIDCTLRAHRIPMTEFAITESALEPQSLGQNQPVPAIVANQLTKNYRTGFWLNQKINSLQSCSVTV